MPFLGWPSAQQNLLIAVAQSLNHPQLLGFNELHGPDSSPQFPEPSITALLATYSRSQTRDLLEPGPLL
jgi:hypothetical protein